MEDKEKKVLESIAKWKNTFAYAFFVVGLFSAILNIFNFFGSNIPLDFELPIFLILIAIFLKIK